MTSEISSVTQSLQPSARELPSSSAAGQAQKGQPVDGAQHVIGTKGAAAAMQKPQGRAEEEKKSDDEALSDTVSDLNELVQNMRRELQFSLEKESGELVVKVIDTETDEVVRQIPPEEVIELRRRLSDAAGAIFRESV
jgi:flagellar protein FlaG